MTQSSADEIDLGVVFSKIKESFNNLLISIYYGIQFLIKNWWIIFIVAIIGAASGYIINKNRKPSKTTTIIVQNSFNSTSYVYSAIEQLNNKLGDTLYLKENGFNPEGVINEIEIKPIVNILELLEKTMYNYRAIEPLLEKADFEDDLLTSEVFYTDYKFHKIILNTSNKAEDKTIQSLIDHLNNNSKFNEIKGIVVEDTKDHIIELENTIKGVNNIIKAFSEKPKENTKTDEIYISMGSIVTDLGILVEKKSSALKLKEKLKTELVKYDKIVTVLNNPVLQNKPSIFSLNIVSTSLLFVFLYLFFFFFKHKYMKIKAMANIKNSTL